jgi:bifunctional enzyme CysN/CysC/sulfate adenylyltransferase subunit 1
MRSSLHLADQQDFASFLEQDLNTGLLRFTTAGSVDDGKSTLIGRLLHDSKSVYEDQLASVKGSRVNRSTGPIDFSLLTDGLRAEREQGITIDVAYRYFATAKRKFIIADTPGHEQYTRNMATGASTADLAIVLIDGTKGLLPQTRRHAYIASLLGIPQVLAAVNKMDLVGHDEETFLRLQKDFEMLARQLGIRNVQCIPISALEGDNVVEASKEMRWYSGPTLLEHLETVPLDRNDSQAGLRFPIQSVIRPDGSFRGFAGQIANGAVKPGDAVLALPSGQTSHVQAIVTFDGNLPRASAPMSVTLQLEDEIDLSRGDMLVSTDNAPHSSRTLEAMVVWLHQNPLEVGRTYLVKHAVRQTKIRATSIQHRVNINTLQNEQTSQLAMNEIGLVEFEAHVPLFFDPYSCNRVTGSFILIDALSNATVGAGMIQEISASSAKAPAQSQVDVPAHGVSSQERTGRHGHLPALFHLPGRPELAQKLERLLFDSGFEVLHLSAADLPATTLEHALNVALSAGVILIYSGKPASQQSLLRISDGKQIRFIEFSAAQEASGLTDDESLRRLVSLADSLKLTHTRDEQGKVN